MIRGFVIAGVSLALFCGCTTSSSVTPDPGPPSTVVVGTGGGGQARITAGGSGLYVTPGACIGKHSHIIKKDRFSTTVTVTSGGPGNPYAITDSGGNSENGKAGTTVQFDQAKLHLVNPPPSAGTVQSFTIQAATGG